MTNDTRLLRPGSSSGKRGPPTNDNLRKLSTLNAAMHSGIMPLINPSSGRTLQGASPSSRRTQLLDAEGPDPNRPVRQMSSSSFTSLTLGPAFKRSSRADADFGTLSGVTQQLNSITGEYLATVADVGIEEQPPPRAAVKNAMARIGGRFGGVVRANVERDRNVAFKNDLAEIEMLLHSREGKEPHKATPSTSAHRPPATLASRRLSDRPPTAGPSIGHPPSMPRSPKRATTPAPLGNFARPTTASQRSTRHKYSPPLYIPLAARPASAQSVARMEDTLGASSTFASLGAPPRSPNRGLTLEEKKGLIQERMRQQEDRHQQALERKQHLESTFVQNALQMVSTSEQRGLNARELRRKLAERPLLVRNWMNVVALFLASKRAAKIIAFALIEARTMSRLAKRFAFAKLVPHCVYVSRFVAEVKYQDALERMKPLLKKGVRSWRERVRARSVNLLRSLMMVHQHRIKLMSSIRRLKKAANTLQTDWRRRMESTRCRVVLYCRVWDMMEADVLSAVGALPEDSCKQNPQMAEARLLVIRNDISFRRRQWMLRFYKWKEQNKRDGVKQAQNNSGVGNVLRSTAPIQRMLPDCDEMEQLITEACRRVL
uniref:Uncharacterized protein n=1 Tax=Eutreptiella gymnastica TaxID=73025 RepID=A0A7S1IDX3_9EUGL|mmetsp:Transcript_149564/g.261386  ORF Transcript_149564/g.261386 Transcript_149564/m.261386 type:complete len:603 (+) Transcript_149564:183-1991(+)